MYEKKLLSHSYKLQCQVCKCFVHINCLPYITKDDSLFTERDRNIWYCTICTEHIFPFNHYIDNITFLQTISESWMDKSKIDFENIMTSDKFFLHSNLMMITKIYCSMILTLIFNITMCVLVVYPVTITWKIPLIRNYRNLV